ncbi:hypothetical protein MTR67_039316, partial [Solanum verrucosum]
ERKEKKEEESPRSSKFNLWNSSGVIPTRYVGDLIHVSELFFELDWLYIEGTTDPRCLGKELWKLGRFREEERKRKGS